MGSCEAPGDDDHGDGDGEDDVVVVDAEGDHHIIYDIYGWKISD